MNILFISECQKKALTETRRILDTFLERKGERTWQGALTKHGLDTIRKLLKKTARKNTAIACHWIRGKDHTELLWVVGKQSAFNEYGAVPTHITTKNVIKNEDEEGWNTAEVIALLAGISGLFHDFGKANNLFQDKLDPKVKNKVFQEPYRHEWVSLRLFQAFVEGSTSDKEWLERLASISPRDEKAILERLVRDTKERSPNPFMAFKALPLAKVIGWLVVSHHRLPKYHEGDNEPRIDNIDEWMTGKRFGVTWNSPQSMDKNKAWKDEDWRNVWEFKNGTPLQSNTWCVRAKEIAGRALKHSQLFSKDWIQDDRFTTHMARLSLMLADHYYSSRDLEKIEEEFRDSAYKAYANTDRKTGALKQKLDEHNIGVGTEALKLGKAIPKIRQLLPSLTRHKGFKKRSTNAKFSWQDKAYDLACGLSYRSKTQGFFGVNMASTGCGKTFANARIMYGLADEKVGCRFNIALGLRTLTLQTGDALRNRLHLATDDLAVLIGSEAVLQLHNMQNIKKKESESSAAEQSGSESSESMIPDHYYIRYDGGSNGGKVERWLKHDGKMCRLLNAPVLVSTIDHLIPATEGERGGRQIGPMLRLLTSDLVLDEPDDFDLADVPALCRLVNWAGMLGSRVLLSSATLPPALVEGLFDAYLAGRKIFNAACGEADVPDAVCCAWFDEKILPHASDHARLEGFAAAHAQFVDKRVDALTVDEPLRHAALLPITADSRSATDVVLAMASVIHQHIHVLHHHHHEVHEPTGKKISIGLVRMANINPMVAVAQEVLRHTPLDDCRVHFCIYHSQYPLLVRSEIEATLDKALMRDKTKPERLWEVPAIKKILHADTETNHLFIVFATSVAEVGRDHDYDWAIAEPSSMRSLIQLAGRIQRHRQKPPLSNNFLILDQNFKALKGDEPAYTRSGFESRNFRLKSKNLEAILLPEQYTHINAVPRIKARAPLQVSDTLVGNLADLEHAHLRAKIFGFSGFFIYSALWWQSNATWCAELQRHDTFRKSAPEEVFVLGMKEEEDKPEFYEVEQFGKERGRMKSGATENLFNRAHISRADGVQPWIECNVGVLILEKMEELGLGVEAASRKFSEIMLRVKDDGDIRKWQYHPCFGVYGEL